MKVGEFIDKPVDMSIESIDEKTQTAVCVWIDVKSGKICRCEIPLSALEKANIKEN